MIRDGIFSFLSVMSLIGLAGCAVSRILSVKTIQKKIKQGLIVIKARKPLSNKAELFVIRSFGEDLLVGVTASNIRVLARSRVPCNEKQDAHKSSEGDREDKTNDR